MSDAVERSLSLVRKLALHKGNARYGCEIYVGRPCTCGLSDAINELEKILQAFQREKERLRPLAEAHVRELEIQYEQSGDGAHYEAWQAGLAALQEVSDE